jgi:hypothetical protein
MKTTLQRGGMTHSCILNLSLLLRRNLKALILALILLAPISNSLSAQATDNNVIKGWDRLEEADFLFDVFYQIVKCNPVGSTEVHLWAFNEGGNVDAVGFTLTLKDEDGTEATHTIEKFDIGFGKSHKADCMNADYPYLKFALPEGIDVESLSIDITYNK